MAENTRSLPSQSQYIENGLIPVTETLEDESCTICTSLCDPESQCDPESEVVQLLPCFHYFHRECITLWFTSGAEGQGSCPNCRVRLFRREAPQPSVRFDETIRRYSESVLDHVQAVLDRYQYLNGPSSYLEGYHNTTEDREYLNHQLDYLDDCAYAVLRRTADQDLHDRMRQLTVNIRITLEEVERRYVAAINNAELLKEHIARELQTIEEHLLRPSSTSPEQGPHWLAEAFKDARSDFENLRTERQFRGLHRIMRYVHAIKHAVMANAGEAGNQMLGGENDPQPREREHVRGDLDPLDEDLNEMIENAIANLP